MHRLRTALVYSALTVFAGCAVGLLGGCTSNEPPKTAPDNAITQQKLQEMQKGMLEATKSKKK